MIENRPKFHEVFGISQNEGKGIFQLMKDSQIVSPIPEYLNLDPKHLLALDISACAKGFDRSLGTFYDYLESISLPQGSLAQPLAEAVLSVYNAAWSYQYKALTADYNPINNYDSVENSTDTHEYTGTQTTEHEATKNNTDTPDITRTSNGTNDSSGSLYGFNSTSAVPSDEANGQSQSTDRETGTVTSNGKENGTNTRTDNLKETITHELTRSGNIGVTTSQQMIESELELRKKQFYNIMIRDIINFLCLPIY